MQVIMPKKRDNKQRPSSVPQSVIDGQKLQRPTLRQMQEQMGGAGVFNFPLQEHFMLQNPEWKYDDVPEIMDGQNIADFVDADILQKLNALEKEEELLEQQQQDKMEESDEQLSDDMLEAYDEIRNK